MQVFDIRIRWSPGHTGIEGNEATDQLANTGALTPVLGDTDQASQPTVSGIHSVFRELRTAAQHSWWTQRSTKLSRQYKKWNLSYKVKPLCRDVRGSGRTKLMNVCPLCMDATTTATCNFSDLPGFKWKLTGNHIVNGYVLRLCKMRRHSMGLLPSKELPSREAFRGRC
jgi:hypothetical protein